MVFEKIVQALLNGLGITSNMDVNASNIGEEKMFLSSAGKQFPFGEKKKHAYILLLIMKDVSLKYDNRRYVFCTLKGEDMNTVYRLIMKECKYTGQNILNTFEHVKVIREDNFGDYVYDFERHGIDPETEIFPTHIYEKIKAEMTAVELAGEGIREYIIDLSKCQLVCEKIDNKTGKKTRIIL